MGKADRLGEQPLLQGKIPRNSRSREVTKKFAFINNLPLMTAAKKILPLRTSTSVLFLSFSDPVFLKNSQNVCMFEMKTVLYTNEAVRRSRLPNLFL